MKSLCLWLTLLGWIVSFVFFPSNVVAQGNGTDTPTPMVNETLPPTTGPPEEVDDCLSITNCNDCILSTLGCGWCFSEAISGCINDTQEFQTTCETILAGEWNNCGANGTDCYLNEDCETCTSSVGCQWCNIDEDTGYCLGDTLVTALLCSTGLEGSIATNCGGNPPPSGEDRCESFQGPSPCLPFVFYDVFVGSNDSQARMTNEANEILGLSSIPGIPVECREAGFPFVCGSAFQECQQIPDTDIVIGIPLCKSFCLKFNDECGQLLRDAGVEPPNCDEIDPQTQREVYPEGTFTYSINGRDYEFQCNDLVSDDPGFYPERVRNGGFEEINNTLAVSWESSSTSYEIVNDTVASSISQTMLMSNNGSQTIYAIQEIILNQIEVLTLRLRGRSKAMNVSGTTRNTNYAILASIVYRDGTTDSFSCLFEPGTHDYELEEQFFVPQKAVERITLQIVFRNTSGMVWFDDVSMRERIPENNEIVCIDPLVPNIGAGRNDDVCVLPCPAPVWSDENYRNIILSREIISWISFFLALWVILTWILRNRKRVSSNMDDSFLYIAICTLGIAFAGGPFSTIVGQMSMLCTNNHDRNDDALGENAGCLIQGIVYTFFSMALMYWWVCMAIKLYLAIHYPQTLGQSFLKKGRYRFSTEKGTLILYSFHIISWGIPFVFTIAAVSSRIIGAGLGGVVCWVRTNEWQWASIYGPICVCMAIVAAPITKILHTIYKITKGIDRPQNWAVHLRFLAFLLFFFINFSVSFTFQVYVEAGEDSWYESAEDYIVCKATNPDGYCPGIRGPSVVAFYFLNLVIASEGILIFLIFGVQRENFQVWKRFIIGNYEILSTKGSNKGTSGRESVELRSSSNFSTQKEDVENSVNSEQSDESFSCNLSKIESIHYF